MKNIKRPEFYVPMSFLVSLYQATPKRSKNFDAKSFIYTAADRCGIAIYDDEEYDCLYCKDKGGNGYGGMRAGPCPECGMITRIK